MWLSKTTLVDEASGFRLFCVHVAAVGWMTQVGPGRAVVGGVVLAEILDVSVLEVIWSRVILIGVKEK